MRPLPCPLGQWALDQLAGTIGHTGELGDMSIAQPECGWQTMCVSEEGTPVARLGATSEPAPHCFHSALIELMFYYPPGCKVSRRQPWVGGAICANSELRLAVNGLVAGLTRPAEPDAYRKGLTAAAARAVGDCGHSHVGH